MEAWDREMIRALCGSAHIFPQRDRESAIAHHSLLPSRPMIAWNDICRGMKSIDWELIWRSKIRFVFLREIRYEIFLEQRNNLVSRRLKLSKKKQSPLYISCEYAFKHKTTEIFARFPRSFLCVYFLGHLKWNLIKSEFMKLWEAT